MSALVIILIALTLVSWIWATLDLLFYAKGSRSLSFWLLVIFGLPIVGGLLYFQSRFYKVPVDE